jgi:N-acyl-D-aspartate/D-glutamate deacylase
MYPIDEADVALLRLLTRASSRPVTWLALFDRPGEPDFHHIHTVPRLGDLLARAMSQVSPRPIYMQGDLRNPTMYSTYRAWQPAFQRTVAEQIALYQQPAFRDAFVEDIALRKRHHLWGQTRVLEVMHPALGSYEGKTIHEIAALERKRPVDAYLDLAIVDDLQIRFQTALFNYDEAGVERLIRDERFLIGLSDGEAHVDVLCDAGYATALVDMWVQQREVLSLEQAVRKVTAVPAALFGIPNRGTLAEGSVADLVLFDPQTVAAMPPEYVRNFPRQGRRLISKAEGVVATFVAGTQVYAQGTHTGAFPGRVLRSHA